MLFHSMLFHDLERNRVDIPSSAADVITGVCALVVAISVPSTQNVALLLLCALGMRYLFSVLGASNIASTIISLVAAMVIAPYSAVYLLTVAMYIAAGILLFEFLKNTNAKVGLILGLATGLLASMQGRYGFSLLLVVVGLSGSYVVWRLVFSRPSKKVFVKMIAKTLLSVALAIGSYAGLGPLMRNLVPPLGAPIDIAVNPILLGVIVMLALYGLWATILLKTVRSPQYRGVRLFLLIATVIILLLWWLLQKFGPEVFSSGILYTLADIGIIGWPVPMFCLSMFVIGLFASAGLERPLFKRSISKADS